MPLFALALMLLPRPAVAGSIELHVAGLDHDRGSVRVGAFDDPAAFPSSETRRGAVTHAEKGTTIVHLEVPAGRWALAIFHDEDDDGILDTGLLGAPTEPYAFSDRAPQGMRPPPFDRAAVEVPDVGTIRVEVELRTLPIP